LQRIDAMVFAPLANRPGFSRPILELLTEYARAHRDQRNIQTHLLAIPLGVMGLTMLLRGPQDLWSAANWTPAALLCALAVAWYLTRGLWSLGLASAAFLTALVYAAHWLPADGLTTWLSWTLGLLMPSVLLQAAGHYYEGRRPASWNGPIFLLVGPMFITLQWLRHTRLLRPVAAEISQRAGPVIIRDLAHPLPSR
jgi:uncharacterized membrane protein YGL010W